MSLGRLRYYVNGKRWHPQAGLLARARAFALALTYDGEICGLCGRRVGLVWWAPDDLWRRLTGWREGGTMCPRCFDGLAAEDRVVLVWRPGLHPATAPDAEACTGSASRSATSQEVALWN